MTLWRKLTIDWPCALGDWLWVQLVVRPAAFLDRLTFRLAFRIIVQIALLAILLKNFEQIVSLDLTFLFTLDAGIYWEVGAALFVIAARGHVRQRIAMAAAPIHHAAAKIGPRFAARQRRAPSRRPELPQPSSDDPDGAWDHAFA